MKITINAKDLGATKQLKDLKVQQKILNKQVKTINKTVVGLQKAKAEKDKNAELVKQVEKENKELLTVVDNLKNEADQLVKEIL